MFREHRCYLLSLHMVLTDVFKNNSNTRVTSIAPKSLQSGSWEHQYKRVGRFQDHKTNPVVMNKICLHLMWYVTVEQLYILVSF